MNYLSQFREANPDLQGFSDEQIVEALPQLLPERFGGKPMSQVRAEALLEPEELEIRQYEQQGGGIGSSIERGLLRANQTFNAAGAALGEAVMGAMPESVRESDIGQWLQGQADQDKLDIVRDQERMGELPQRPEMLRAIEAANNAETGMGAIGAFAKEVWSSPDTAGFLVDTMAEQIPVMATMALGTKGAGGLFGTSSALGRAATFGTGAGIGSGSTTFGSNVAEAMGQDISKFDEATDYAFKRSLAQAIVDGTVGAVVPFKIGGNQIVNIPTQAVLQAAGGAAGEYAGGTAVGEEVSKGELVAEGLLELLSLPADLAMANIEYFNSKHNPVGDANARINAAGDQVAAAGGDALAQESTKAQAASSEIPGAVSEAKTIADTLKAAGQVSAADLGIQMPEQRDWSQFDTAPGTESRVSLEPRQAEQPAPRQSARDMSGLDGLIITADRMGFADEAALLRTSQRLYRQAEQAKAQGDNEAASRFVDRGNRLYREATETNDQVREIADQFPVPYVATGEVTGGEVGPYQGPGRTGETFDQPRSVGGPASLEQQRTNRLTDSGIIFGEEPDYARAQRQQMESERAQRTADDFSARYGQEGQTPFQPTAIEGELDRSNELPPAQPRAALPPGTGQVDLGQDRPQQGIQQPQAGYDGIGRNAVERTAQAKTNALPAGNATRAITPDQYRNVMERARLALRTPVSRRTPEMTQALEVREQVRAGQVAVSENAQPDTPSIAGEQIDQEWTRFTPESGTLNVPRAEMPQVKAENRGALVNYLNARGIEHQQAEIDPRTLKPTQAEFSPAKVQKAREFTGGDRSILVSADGYVVDGHHQWMAKRDTGEPVKVIQLQAPIDDLVPLIRDFPSSERDGGAQSNNGQANADQPELRLKANGAPFASERAAQASTAFRDNRDYATVVPVDGGFAVQIDTQARDRAETQAVESAQAKSEQAKSRMFREPDTVNDDMLDAIALMGGIDRAEAEAEGIDPANFGRQAGGIRYVFPRQNGDSFDGMAERLAQYGYLDPRVDRLDDLRDKLDQAINGNAKIMTPEGYEALAEKEAAAEAQLQQEHEPLADDITSDEAWAGEAYANALEQGVPAPVIDAILEQYSDDPVIALVELNDAINQSREASGTQAGESQESGSDNLEATLTASRPFAPEQAAEIWGSVDPDPEPLLSSYTESDLQAQADTRTAVEEAEARAQREAEQKAQADAEVNDFSLTGSNRPADVAAAAGQNDMFGLGGTPRTEPARPTKSLIHKDNAGRILDTLISEYEKARKRYLNRYAKNQYTKTPDPDLIKQATTKVHNLPNEGWSEVDVVLGSALMPVITNPRAANYQELITDAFYTAAGIERPQSSDQQPQAAPQPIESAVIDDVGEKLGRARKDELRTARERLGNMDDEQIASSTLSKLWPKSEIDKIEDPVSAAIYHTARNMVPNKPRIGYKLKRWVDQVKQARDLLNMVDEIGSDKFIQAIRDKRIYSLQSFADKVELLTGVDRSQWDRIGRVEKASGTYREGEEMVSGSWMLVEIDKRMTVHRGASEVSEIIAPVNTHLEKSANEQPAMKFEIRHDRRHTVYQINKTGDNEQRPLKTFDTLKEARDYLRNNNADLVEAWEAVKQRDNVTKADMRSDKNRERTGQDYRGGKDVTAEEFIETFGFRGAEFGNWVKQGKAGQERQGLLNDAYDAFMDLANVLGLPPKALSFEGRLGIGFGSRGRGGRNAAHYEPDLTVINLTKTKGAGSLAHEWFHALDNYFSRKRGDTEFNGDQKAYREGAFVTYRPEPMMAYKPSMKSGRNPYLITNAEYNRRKERGMGFNESDWTPDPNHPQGIRPEVEKAFAELVETLDASPMLTRAQVIDKGKVDGYWSQIIERAARSFETHIIAKLAQKGYRNDFLANVTSFEKFKRDPGRYPYLKPDEQGPVSEAFDKLFSTIETKETESGVAMFSRTDDAGLPISRDQVEVTATRITSNWTNAPEMVTVATDRDLPADLQETIDKQNARGKIDGVFHKGRFYLVADKIRTEADVERIVLHEALGHYGLRQLYGPAFGMHMDRLFNRVGGYPGIQRLGKKYGFDLSSYWENAGDMSLSERREMMADELIAHIAGTGTVQPDLIQQIAHLIRKGLRKIMAGTRFAERLDQMTDVEVLRIVAAARKAVVEGESQITVLTHDPRFVRDFETIVYGDARFSRVPDDAPVIETDGGPIAKGKTVKEMALRAREYARKHFAGKAFRNENTGDEIILPMAGVRHTLAGAQADLIKSVAVTPEIIKQGAYLGSRPEEKGNPSVLAHHYYGAKIQIDGRMHDVVVDVREMADGKRYYDHAFERKTGPESTAPSNARNPNPVEMDITTSTDSIEDDQDVRFSRTESSDFAKPEETHLKVALRKIADKFQVLKDLQKNIQDAGGTVNESNDAYLAEELFHGKTEEDLRQMRETFIKPLADKMAKFGIEQKGLDQYLYAKHAPERNAHIAEINPELQEAGSGMSDGKAAEIIQQVRESGKLEQYEQLAGMVYDMLETRRETIRSAGLEEDGMIDAWENKYEFYVPLKGWAADEKQEGTARTGSGFNIAGKESKRAMGRSSEAASPSSYAIQDLTETLIRRRKNEVGNALLKLVEDNPNKDYWQVFTNENPDIDRQIFRSETEASKQARTAAKKAGQPEPARQYQETVRETPIPMAMMSDKYFQTKRDGKAYFIKLEDERLMKAMKNIGPDTSSFLIRKLGAVNRVLSSLNTSYNPEFVVGNFARDVQTAVLNLMAEQSRDDGKALGEKIAKQTVKDIPKAMKAVYRGLRNKDEAAGGEWQKWFTEFREAGAKTGWFDMKDIDGQAADLQSLISMSKGGVKGTAMKWFKATGQMVEDLNGSVENAVRLSAYVNARKAGISQAKAASLAKNMTVNFNRRGEVGTTLNALYMFANASIQGSMNFARTMIGLKGQKGDPIWQRLNTAQKVAAGLVMGSYAIAMANRFGAGEDDDGENWYDKVPDYVKERNLVIMKSLLGGEQDGSYWTIPLPYGYNIFHVLGNSIEATTNGTTSIGEAATDLTLAALGSFSPIGFQESQSLTGTVVRNITPTIGKPLVDIGFNENFMGTSIYNENFPFGTPKPESQLGRRSTPEGYKAIAEFLNDVSGGSQWRSGYIDINPDVMRYVANYFTGAAGKFVFDKAPNNIYHLATLTPIESREALFWSRISGKVLPYDDREKFYSRRDELNQTEAEWKGLTGGDRVQFYRENRKILALRPLIQSAEKQLKALRKQRDRIYAMDLPRREQEARLESIDARMKRVIDRFNRRYKQATSGD